MGKRIVVCADGTWNRPETDLKVDVASNVLRLARAVRPRGGDRVDQQVFYDWGVGSYHDKVVGGATGRGIEKNIKDGYRYIVQNYSHGDELYLFGFSRGAYTVRCLSGLINNCGILKRPDARLIEEAYQLYKRKSKRFSPRGSEAISFRDAHSHRSRRVHFVGVWDTVGALGIPLSFFGLLEEKDLFYDSEIGSNVGVARHAMAIDEMRADFVPTIWKPKPGCDIEQVWFSGVHSDIGGGYPADRDGSRLSDIPLAWMVSEARRAGLSIESHLSSSITINHAAKVHRSRKGLYRAKFAKRREIAHGEGPVMIHRSVVDRWNGDGDYRRRSKKLSAFVDEHGWEAAQIVS